MLLSRGGIITLPSNQIARVTTLVTVRLTASALSAEGQRCAAICSPCLLTRPTPAAGLHVCGTTTCGVLLVGMQEQGQFCKSLHQMNITDIEEELADRVIIETTSVS